MVYKILSFGGGVQTMALLLKIGKQMDYVIFADTGGEHDETYEYMNLHVKKYCNENNIKFVRVYSKYGKTLYDYCWDKHIVPSIKFRDCTSKFKIAPIRRFLRKELGITRADPCEMNIGISWDEVDRMNESNVLYVKNKYPLVDERITRSDCEMIIATQGYPIPPKSGCFFCPFAKSADLLNPKYKARTIALEENNSRFPEIKLRGMGKYVKPIRELSEKDLAKDGCKTGYCMV